MCQPHSCQPAEPLRLTTVINFVIITFRADPALSNSLVKKRPGLIAGYKMLDVLVTGAVSTRKDTQ